ncbi:MAG: hypothetical protein FJZ43_02460 [Candidatus Staskawiczbacteria bacterium]|nr:hypothetical protein [Candidatus Staskawiczbacteria bacterium]
MMILLPFMDILSLSYYLRRLVREISQVRLFFDWRGQDIPESYTNRMRIVLIRFLKLSEKVQENMVKDEISKNEGEIIVSLYFSTDHAREIYSVIGSDEIPLCRRMRDVGDDKFKELESKLNSLIHLLECFQASK